MIEQTVANRYDLEYELGTGAVGTVYQALDLKQRKLVALKLFSKHLCSTEEARRAILDHAERLSALTHPRIAQVLDWGEADGQVYVASELAQGGSLRALLSSTERLRPERAVVLVSQVAEAIDAAHQQGLVHGDLRPENVLLDSAGGVKVTDLGWIDLAEAQGLLDPSATPALASLDTAKRRGGAGAQADVYLLSVLLYELLSGRMPPVPSGPRASVAYSPRLANPAVPPWLERTVVNGLGDDQSRRFNHAAALRNALEAPLTSPTQAGAYSLENTRRRSPVLAVLRGFAGLFLRLFAVGLPAIFGGVIVAVVVTTYLVGRLVFSGPVSDLVQVEAPSLVGMTFDQASEKAMPLGVTVARNSERPTEDRPKDTVLNQWPVPGTSVRRGTVIRLAVSSGLRVPSVVGKNVDDARRELEAAGWKVGNVDNTPTFWAAPGIVVQQTPAADDIAPDRSALRLSVAVLPPNLALNAPVRATGGDAHAAVDDKLDTVWDSGSRPPAWIEIDLGGPHAVQRIELVVSMKPEGWAGHEIWTIDSKGKEQKVYVFGGEYKDGQTLTQTFTPALADVAKVRIVTSGSVATPAWREVRVY